MATISASKTSVRNRPETSAPADPTQKPAAGKSWYAATTWMPALIGSLLLYAAFPPVDFWPLAWLAPVCWLALIRRQELPGKRPYVVFWLAGFTYWFLLLQWLRLPHPATAIGWVALSVYLGLYLAVFAVVTRTAVHRLRLPLIVAAPIVWTGLEFAQSHIMTGFNLAALAHSQWRWLPLIQIADLAGSYAVSFLIVLVAACLARCLPLEQHRWQIWPLAVAAAALAGVLAYGYWRLDHEPGRPGPKIALIQGSIDTELKHDPEKQASIYPHYFGLSREAVEKEPDLDLIVWPETMYRDSLLSMSDDAVVPPGWQANIEQIREAVPSRKKLLSQQADLLGTPLLLGLDYLHLGPHRVDHYNSALLVNRNGTIGPRYDKMHPVPFGEFMPFARRFEWLAELSPIGAGIDWGTEVPAFDVAGARLATNICYESVIPHVIRQQVTTLRQRGEEPDILVNLTNDGWFHGSSALDLHLTCAIFRAVECRKPFLIAANTGFSAWIDADGRLLRRGPRKEAVVLLVQPQIDDRHSPYLTTGDLPASLCLVAAVCFGLLGLFIKASGRTCILERTARASFAGPE